MQKKSWVTNLKGRIAKMADIEKVISGLQYTVEMVLFDPATGYSKDPDDLNDLDRITYDACIGAIALLKEQEAKMVKVIKNAYNEEFYCCPNCDKQFYGYFKRPLYCDQCGQAVKWNG